MDLTLAAAGIDARRARVCVRWQCAQLPAHAQQHTLLNEEGAPPFARKPSSTGCVHCGRCTAATITGDKFWGRNMASLPHHRHAIDVTLSSEYSL